jgi:putative two-component system response regulator
MDKPKEIILVVEDNLVLREGLHDILTYAGYEVLNAAHGVEALEQMSQRAADLILSDIAMPVMDGYELYHKIRQRPEWVTIPFIFLTARSEREDIFKGIDLGVEEYLIKPVTREELLVSVRSRLERSHQIRLAQLQQAYEASLTVLANAIDVRDPYTRGHVERVTAYANELALRLGCNPRNQEQIRFGAILHDIGKIIIQEKTLLKAGSLNKEEWNEIRKHPVTGSEMIKDIPYLAPAIPIIRHHHERWDGMGYPDRLAGESIPLGARIIAVTDSFDAMTIDRPYRKGFDLQHASQEIITLKGSQYDPAVVDAFQTAWGEGTLQAIWETWRVK